MQPLNANNNKNDSITGMMHTRFTDSRTIHHVFIVITYNVNRQLIAEYQTRAGEAHKSLLQLMAYAADGKS